MPGTFAESDNALDVMGDVAFRVERHHRRRVNRIGGCAVLGEEVRKLHRETAGMGGGQQFLGVGAGFAAFILEAPLKEYGCFSKAPDWVSSLPLPSFRLPDQCAVAWRFMVCPFG